MVSKSTRRSIGVSTFQWLRSDSSNGSQNCDLLSDQIPDSADKADLSAPGIHSMTIQAGFDYSRVVRSECADSSLRSLHLWCSTVSVDEKGFDSWKRREEKRRQGKNDEDGPLQVQ